MLYRYDISTLHYIIYPHIYVPRFLLKMPTEVVTNAAQLSYAPPRPGHWHNAGPLPREQQHDTFAGQAWGFCLAKAMEDGQHPWEEAATAAQEQVHRWNSLRCIFRQEQQTCAFPQGPYSPRRGLLGRSSQSGYLKLDGALRN